MGMHIDARPRFQLLEKAIASPDGIAESEKQQYKITVLENPSGERYKALFEYKEQIVTTLHFDNKIEHVFLTADNMTEIVKDIMALTEAIEKGLINNDDESPIIIEQAHAKVEKGIITDQDWTIISEPTKVKHKKDTHGKPLLSIPIRRPDAQKSGVSTESWVMFAFKEITRPDDAKRPGGYGRGCQK